MAIKLRKTGISVVGDAHWGTHFCHFYETKQDLLDILVPYFKAGLESKEFCLWVASNSKLITVEEAKGALEQAVPDLDRHLSDGNIEIVNGLEWYLAENVFTLERVTSAWDAKLERALALGYDGMRVSGDTLWLGEKDWKDFCAYEKHLNDSITDRPMTVLCTYPLTKSGAAEILDVVQIHQFAIARRQGEWVVIETPELIQAKAEIVRLNEVLEQRVIERTIELRVANEELRKEIIERKQAEALLHAKEQEFRAIVENAPDQIIRYDREFRRTYVNPAVAKAYGLPAEALTGKPLGSVIQDAGLNVKEDELAKIRQRIAAVFDTGKSYEYEITWPMPTGRKYYSVRLFPELDFNGSVINVLAIARDITERKQAEEKLKQSESQLAEAQRVAHVGYWERNLDTDEIIWSDETYRIFGLQPQESIENFQELIHPEDRLVQVEATAQTLRGEPSDVGYRVVRPDGEIRLVHSRGEAIRDESGRPRRAFGTVQDVTELKHADEKLKATTEQLRALSASLQSAREEEGTRIAREIHDELGSALTSLRWDLEGIEDIFSEPEKRSQVPALRKKIEAMMELTDTTINIVRRIASELRPSVLDDLGLVEAIAWQARQFQDRTGIVVHCDCSLDDVDLNQEQSTAIFRIFQEALTNIRRHAQATRVDVTTVEEADAFVLTIRDNGRGITEDEKSGHLSIGLLGMRERAHLIGGKIDIVGVEGEGTTVTVGLPIVRAEHTFEGHN